MPVLAQDRLITVVTFGAAIAVPIAFGIRRLCTLWWEYKWKVKPLFRCSGCHRDIYPPAYKRLHVGLATYCAECEAKYWQEAEALRARMK